MIRSKLMLLTASFSIAAGSVLFAAAPTTAPSAYPLTKCIVSGETLGEMGSPVTINYEGREVKFCCTHCEAKFKKNPEKYLKEIDAAAAKPTTQPS